MNGSSRLTSDAEAGSARLLLPAALPTLTTAAVAATAALAAGLTAASLGWPLVHDAPLMHYIAARLLEGAAPYRDLFDMNFPGVYLVHVLGLVLFGGGDAGFRALDLAVLAGATAGLAVALAPFGRWAAASGAALFWLYHLAGGAWRAGQRDLILCVPLAWLVAVLLAERSPRRFALAGAALGAAVWVKPHVLLLLPVLGAVAWRRAPGTRAHALTAAAVGAALPALLILAWLAAAGGLPAFLDIVVRYLVPLYSGLGRGAILDAVGYHDLGIPAVMGLGLWAAGGLGVLCRAGCRDSRAGVLAAGLGYGVLHFVLQGKGWEYHLYPFALFAVAAGAAGLGLALETGRRVATGGLLAALVLTSLVLGAKGWRSVESSWVAAKAARARAAAVALGPLVGDRGTVQVLDTTEGGVHALYLLRARQPTRFLYDFHFYHDVEHAYVRALRREFIDGLRERPPAAVVLFERGWPAGGYERVGRFAELEAWLADGYRIAHEGDGFRVYAARRDR